MRMKNKVKFTFLKALAIKFKKISTHLLARLGWFCPVVSEPVKPYFTRLLRVLTFCLEASKIVILKENGVVNGVVKSMMIHKNQLAKIDQFDRINYGLVL